MTQSTYKNLLKIIHECDDYERLVQLFDAILTEKEQQDVTNRLQIFAMLQAKKTQRDISEDLGVGIATVSRGAKTYRDLNVEELLPNLNEELGWE